MEYCRIKSCQSYTEKIDNHCRIHNHIRNCKYCRDFENGVTNPISSSSSSIEYQPKCDDCVVGYFDDGFSNSEMREKDKYKYYGDDVVLYEYCPHCGNKNRAVWSMNKDERLR